ncbi:UPF0262 family protein [Amylibacter sp. SFDW26]|uniref:UPF0262 family protein n=1 Tax=Amylibacter sp. SFDW26 TaxID=2652722 RepID=UPI00351A9067
MAEISYLTHIELDDTGLPAPTPEVDQERKIAIYDLIEDNAFGLPDKGDAPTPAGPYKLTLSIQDKRLVFDIVTEQDDKAGEFHLSLSPFRDTIKDYFQICEAYFDAVKSLPAAQIEAIDMGRRGIHDEGGRLVQERLEGKIETDKRTARRLFTLICVLHFRG